MVSALAAAALALAGAMALYAAAPHQRLLPKALPRAGAAAGIAALAGSLALLLTISGPAAAVFVWITAAMTVWSIAPILVAWLKRPKGERP